jgi:hypothetical protein
VETLTLNVLVEGDTEAVVVKDFLSPYWQVRFKKCVVVNYEGSGNLKMKYGKETKRLLEQPDQAVMVLIDVKNDPFHVSTSAPSQIEAYRQVQTILYRGVGMSESERLAVFPVVKEVETWLLADPTITGKTIAHPENEENPASLIRNYRKGQRAKPFFERASAQVVYADNCPHFVKMVDWLQGKTPAREELESTFTLEQQKRLELLLAKHQTLAERIELNIRNGQTAPAGVLRTDLKYIEQQIGELNAWGGHTGNRMS